MTEPTDAAKIIGDAWRKAEKLQKKLVEQRKPQMWERFVDNPRQHGGDG